MGTLIHYSWQVGVMISACSEEQSGASNIALREPGNKRAEVDFRVVLLRYNRYNCCLKVFILGAQTCLRKNIIALRFGKEK